MYSIAWNLGEQVCISLSSMANGDYWAKTAYFFVGEHILPIYSHSKLYRRMSLFNYFSISASSNCIDYRNYEIVPSYSQFVTREVKLYENAFLRTFKKKTSKLIKTDCSSQIIWKSIKEHFENFPYMLWSVMAWDFQVWRWKLPLWWKWFILHSFGHLQHFVGHKRLATNKKLWESAIWTLAVGRVKCQYNG